MLLEAILSVVLPTLFVMAAAIVLGRRQTVSSGDFDADSVSFVGGVLSALFTVVLAFYIVFAWQLGDDVESAASSESNALIDAFWQADGLAEPERSRLQGLLRDYAVTVADREWALLDEGRVDTQVPRIISALRTGFGDLPTDSGAVQVSRELALRDVRQIDESHRTRVDLTTGGSTFNDVLLAARSSEGR